MLKPKLPITFKRSDDTINIGGQQINQANVTLAIYEYLISVSPAHADHFVMEDEPAEEKEEPKKEKPGKVKAEA
jgi:hypothetical protein